MDAATRPCKKITILVAVSVRLYRDGLATMLNTQQFLSIEGTAGTTQEAVDAVRVLQPDIAIIDVSLDDVLELMRALRTQSPRTGILAFAVREDITAILRYAEAGADGFVTGNSSVADLVQAIERTAAGELLCSPRIAAQLLRQAAHRLDHVKQPTGAILTGREEQVFSLLKQGRSNKEIANSLRIAEATVKNHVHHVLEKLKVTTRGKAAAAGLRVARAAVDQHASSRRKS